MSVEEDPVHLRDFRGHKDVIYSLDFCGVSHLASGSSDRSMMLWNNVNRSAQTMRYAYHRDAIYGVRFSSRYNLLASASGDGTICLANVKGQGGYTAFSAHNRAVRSVDFSPNRDVLASCGDDNRVRLWNARTQRMLAQFIGHTKRVRCVRFSPEGELLASCGDDDILRLWDPRTKSAVHSFPERGILSSADFHPSGNYVITSGSESSIRLYDIRDRKLLQVYKCHEDTVQSLAFHPCGEFFMSGGDDCTVRIFDCMEGRCIYTISSKKPVNAVAFSKSGEYFAFAYVDKIVRVFRTVFDRVLTESGDNEKENKVESSNYHVPSGGEIPPRRKFDPLTSNCASTTKFLPPPERTAPSKVLKREARRTLFKRLDDINAEDEHVSEATKDVNIGDVTILTDLLMDAWSETNDSSGDKKDANQTTITVLQRQIDDLTQRLLKAEARIEALELEKNESSKNETTATSLGY